MSSASHGVWRHCSICKAPIGFEAEHFLCSVSTCNRKRLGLFFCSLGCFEAHLPTARHRDAWAEPQVAPSLEAHQRALAQEPGDVRSAPASATPERRVVTSPTPRAAAEPAFSPVAEPEAEVLVVVSKLKKYVRDWSGMNTSDGVLPVLSEHLRGLCREAIRQAGLEGRRTVLDRDFTKVLRERQNDKAG